MKKTIILFFLIFLLSIIFLTYKSNNDDIYIVNENSYFLDYEIVGNKVNTYCELYIYNGFNCDKVVELIANDIDNKEFGLLKESEMKGYLRGTNISEIYLKSGKNIVSVDFIGDLGNNSQRMNRLLPNEINLNIIS